MGSTVRSSGRSSRSSVRIRASSSASSRQACRSSPHQPRLRVRRHGDQHGLRSASARAVEVEGDADDLLRPVLPRRPGHQPRSTSRPRAGAARARRPHRRVAGGGRIADEAPRPAVRRASHGPAPSADTAACATTYSAGAACAEHFGRHCCAVQCVDASGGRVSCPAASRPPCRRRPAVAGGAAGPGRAVGATRTAGCSSRTVTARWRASHAAASTGRASGSGTGPASGQIDVCEQRADPVDVALAGLTHGQSEPSPVAAGSGSACSAVEAAASSFAAVRTASSQPRTRSPRLVEVVSGHRCGIGRIEVGRR